MQIIENILSSDKVAKLNICLLYLPRWQIGER
jgi:hypothetical protein